MPRFRVASEFRPAGDQPEAIDVLAAGVEKGLDFQTLLGVTGSGKTATIAWLIEKIQKPTLVMSPNKSLAAQLANEFREFFPDNAVEYFASYYDYSLARGTFRVRGDTIEIHPAYEETILRIELFGDTIERMTEIEPVSGEIIGETKDTTVYAASHYVASQERMAQAGLGIEEELQ